jgi:hypothetical protein
MPLFLMKCLPGHPEMHGRPDFKAEAETRLNNIAQTRFKTS